MNVIITGANQGLGYFLVEQLLKDGNRVAVFDLEIENLQALKAQYGECLLTFRGDVRDQAQLSAAVSDAAAQFSCIDAAIHNACKCTFEAEADTDIDTYKDVFDVNYFGALRLTKAVLPYMVKQNKGKIIFTSSGVGVMGFTRISPYASSKGAIEALTKCLNIEYAKNNITFHIFHPPLTRTRSASPLPVPQEFMALPEIVGRGLAKHIGSNHYIICHSWGQRIQTLWCYLCPLKMGKLMSKMTDRYENMPEESK